MGRASLHHRPRGRDQRGHSAAVSRPRTRVHGSNELHKTLMGRPLLVTALLVLAGCAPNSQPTLRKAAAYLWTRQEPDGGWHSHTYGLLRSGQSLTPFVLDALLEVPDAVYTHPRPNVYPPTPSLRPNTHPYRPPRTT